MSKLFEPLALRSLTLLNRVIVSPMCQYSAVDGTVQPWHTVHLGQLAMASAGMLIIEATGVEDIGRITPGCVGLYSDENEAALSALVINLRELNPVKNSPLCVQLSHAGRKSSSYEPWNTGAQIPLKEGGWEAVAPSALAQKDGELPPHALSVSELESTKQKFVTAVKRSERIGFDAIEVHCAHGYLLHQFLSPIANQRSDQYGGSLENRMRYPLEVFAAMRAAWPEHLPLGLRLSASDWDSASSWDIDEALVFSKALQEIGCDWIDVSSGGVSQNQKIELKPGYQVHFAQAIKAAVDMPVMAVGLIDDPHQAESIIADEQADMIALARGFLYNPRWVWHAAAQLGATVSAPPQYWRCSPAKAGSLFGDTRVGQR
jgi:2,4-dienoyl-CoA reductase-like NADH-dependent reductase (Old Yellow Enzyme family)